MTVDENTEYYLIHSMGLNKKQIKEMSFKEIEEHCNNIIKQRIKETGIYNSNEITEKPNSKIKKKSKSTKTKQK